MTDPIKGNINIPKLGKVPKIAVIGVAVLGIGYAGYRWYQSRQAVADANATDTTTSDFADGGTLPTVVGGVTDDSGSNTDDTGDTGATPTDFGFHGTTNDEWTQYAVNQLDVSDTWSYTDIVTALGNYLASRPLSTVQQSIVQAAIAVAGHPPVGTFNIIPGGNTSLTVAPAGVTVVPAQTTAVVSFEPVAGAASYVVTVGSKTASGSDSPITVTALTPATSYTFTVAGISTAGVAGPSSSPVTAKTTAATTTTPPPTTTTPPPKTTTPVKYTKYVTVVAYKEGQPSDTMSTLSGIVEALGKKGIHVTVPQLQSINKLGSSTVIHPKQKIYYA